MLEASLVLLSVLCLSQTLHACPADTVPRAAGTLLTVMLPGAPAVAFSESDLRAAGTTRLTQRRTVSAASGIGVEQSTVYDGVLLRDVLARAGLAAATDRSLRTGLVEAIATDGYRAIFSWGELYNAAIGDQVLVIRSQDGTTLDAVAGPLALRSLADLRPGPRHVRNLCAVRVRPV
jgi:hypothetical protein